MSRDRKPSFRKLLVILIALGLAAGCDVPPPTDVPSGEQPPTDTQAPPGTTEPPAQPSTDPGGQLPPPPPSTAQVAPVIAPIPNHCAHAAQNYTLQCRLLAGDGQIEWSLDSFSTMQDMSIDSNGLLTWTTPTEVHPSTHDYKPQIVTVAASNAAGSDEVTFRIEIYPGDNSPPTTLNSDVVLQPIEGGEATLTVSLTFHDAEDDISAVEMDLSRVGGPDKVTVPLQGPADFGAVYAWQGTVVPPANPGTTVGIEVTDGWGSFREYPLIEFRPDGVADGPTVAVWARQIAGSGSKLIFAGYEFDSQLRVPANALMGIVRDGEAFLYHPALGNAELSRETDRIAMAHFILGLRAETNDPMAKRLVRLGKTVEPMERVELKTNVSLVRPDENTIRLVNNANRWVAVVTSEGSRTYFLPPASRTFDSNLCRWLTREGYDLPKSIFDEGEDIIEYFSTTDSLEIDVSSGTVETYAACIRVLPEILIGQDVPMRDEAWQKDAPLVLLVNIIDIYYVMMEGLKHLVGLVPVECLDAAFGYVANWLEGNLLGLWTGEERIRQQWYRIIDQNVRDSLLNCEVFGATLGVWELINTLWDLIAFIDWFVEDVFLRAPGIVGFWAYDSIELTEDLTEITYPACYKGQATFTPQGKSSCTRSFGLTVYEGFEANGLWFGDSVSVNFLDDPCGSAMVGILRQGKVNLAGRSFTFGEPDSEYIYITGRYRPNSATGSGFYTNVTDVRIDIQFNIPRTVCR